MNVYPFGHLAHFVSLVEEHCLLILEGGKHGLHRAQGYDGLYIKLNLFMRL